MAPLTKEPLPDQIQTKVARVYHIVGKGTGLRGRSEHRHLWKALEREGIDVGVHLHRKKIYIKIPSFFNVVDDQIVPTHHYLRLLASIGIEPQEVENHELAVENLQRGAEKSRGRESSCSTPSTGGNDEPPAMENQPIMDPLTTPHSSNSCCSVTTSGGTTSTPRPQDDS